MAFPVGIASLSRTFLSPVVPGWMGPDGIVQLPMRMDGRTVDTGIHIDDDRGLTEWVNQRRDYFASPHTDFTIYPFEDAYLDAVQPPWIRLAHLTIVNTVESYAKALPSVSRLRRSTSILEGRLQELQAIFSAVLYMGNERRDRDFTLFPQDLTLFGPKLEDPNDLGSLVNLLETVDHVDDLLRTGMTDLINVRDESGTSRRLYDSVAITDQPWLEFFDSDGKKIRFPKNAVRPVCTYDLDDEEKINPFASGVALVHEAYDGYQRDMTSRIKLVAGAFLMAHYRMDDQETLDLNRKLLGRSQDAQEIILSHLRSTGRSVGRHGLEFSALLEAALRQVGETQ